MTTPIVPSITDEQLAESERMIAEIDRVAGQIPSVAALIARIRADGKDAARYRWLRAGGYLYSWADLHVCDEHRGAEITDQTIDAAMEQSK